MSPATPAAVFEQSGAPHDIPPGAWQAVKSVAARLNMEPEELLSRFLLETLYSEGTRRLALAGGRNGEEKPAIAFTPRQLEILDFIDNFRRQYRISPTLEEIAKQLRVTKITIYEHVNQLERKGAIKRERFRARSIQVLVPPPERSAGCRYCGGGAKP
jgi:DNA-binding MarR family transcriptional regulator